MKSWKKCQLSQILRQLQQMAKLIMWNIILKEYLLSGNLISNRLSILENKVNLKLIEHEHRLDEHEKKIDFFVRTSLPPLEGVFYNAKYPRPLYDCG